MNDLNKNNNNTFSKEELNKIKKRESCKKWRLKNPNYKKEYAKRNKDVIKKVNAEYYLKNKIRINEKNKKYYKNNKNKQNIRNLKNYYKNKIKYRKTQKRYESKKYKNNSLFKLKKNLRSRIYKIFKTQNIYKNKKCLELLGCSFDKVKKYLESQFKEGMTWDNHSQFGWHIDHIIPLSSFDLSDPEQAKKACHWTNLQPLWWDENLKKSNKLLV